MTISRKELKNIVFINIENKNSFKNSSSFKIRNKNYLKYFIYYE